MHGLVVVFNCGVEQLACKNKLSLFGGQIGLLILRLVCTHQGVKESEK